MTDKFHDKNVEAVITKMRSRAEVGLAKYGTDTTRNDYNFRDWLRNAQEETMDLIVYLQAAMGEMPPGGKCPQCNYLENKLNRHECRPTQVTHSSLEFYEYLLNFELVEHYERWAVVKAESDA